MEQQVSTINEFGYTTEEQENAMNEQGKNIELFLSIIFLIFNTIFILINLFMLKSLKKSTKSLKISLLILVIIDTIKYLLIISNVYFSEGIFYDLINCGIQVLQIYLFISLFKQTMNLIKRKNLYYDESMPPYQYACFSLILIFPYHKIFNTTPKLLIPIQNILSIIIIYAFYKSLNKSLLSIKNGINKKYIKKLQIARNLNFGLNASIGLLIINCLINIIFIFLEQELQEFLKMPLDFIIYLKYLEYSVFALSIYQYEKVLSKKKQKSEDNHKMLKY
jgi:hypothetical protein